MKSIEIYGFVGWVGSFGMFLLYIIWGFLPDNLLNSFGIYFYPDKSWALAIPSVFVMTIIFLIVFYQFLNMAKCKPLDSYTTLQDNFTRFHTKKTEIQDGLPEIYDIPAPVVNNILFYEPEIVQKFDPDFKLHEKGYLTNYL
ncbi:PIG-P protein (macronuclear) [Tetrahymena thermophila SB210]|uniref:PIG-P protein n=1 Tax=Tetrahymena thermophila (strain SB210) TaxID=312017 RepID=W7X9C2_TETTS|nr:PIG-P protein [Tetrahymena thermophila SB210]EWS72983.1 PIG-P protein [Tetrahymena thermophila SB210]|eukprot:XP_012654490.1 PIG-P protein [Tetrahymena thermophila SB210]